MKRVVEILFLILLTTAGTLAQLSFDLEGNYVANSPYNSVRIPRDGGTELDLSKDLKPLSAFTFRVRANYIIKKKHMISALYAPLIINSSGKLDYPVTFNHKVIEPHIPIESQYKFNSYRLTYRYLFISNPYINFWAGITGKVRDASITLESQGKSIAYSNLGIVPLLNIYFLWSPIEHWVAILEADAMVTNRGRAEDVFIGIGHKISKSFSWKVGYRILEGGVNSSEVYNFANIQYASAGFLIHFNGEKKRKR